MEVFGVSLDRPWGCSRPCRAPSMHCFWLLRFHSSCGMVMEVKRLPRLISKQLRSQKKIHSLLNTADRLRSVSENLSFFSILILQNCAKGLSSIHFAKKVDFNRNQLRQ